MSAFLQNINPFRGNGGTNERGEDLETFLEHYDPDKYKNPSVTTDIIVMKYNQDKSLKAENMELLMIKRREHPCIGQWALPGGFVNINEDTEAAAKRELEEETNLKNIGIEQIYTWGEYDRDPRHRIVTVAYLALISEDIPIEAGDDAADAVWMKLSCEKVSEEIIEEDGKPKVCQIYQLKITNENKQAELNGKVSVTWNKDGFIKEKNYQVIESNEIAFDHARFIVQALLYTGNLKE